MKADDFHLPISFIVESGTPASAADVAAPILKLWPLNKVTSKPAEERAFLTAVTNT